MTDTTTSIETLIEAAEQIEAVRPDADGVQEVVADKGYHSNQSLVDLEAVGVRSYILSPNPIGDDGIGRRTPTPATPCTAIDGAFAPRAVHGCSGCAANGWNARSR